VAAIEAMTLAAIGREPILGDLVPRPAATG